jgi:protein required for attachment to host cells
MRTWIVVADTRRARIFEAARSLKEMTELEDFVHEISEHVAESDDSRSRFVVQAHASHGVEPSMTPRTKAMKSFAREIAQYLHKNFLEHRFDECVLAAPPEFLGVLREESNGRLQHAITQTVTKDLTRLNDRELQEFFVGTRRLH